MEKGLRVRASATFAGAAALFLVSAVGASRPPNPARPATNPVVIAVAIEIVRSAARLGLERAGTRLMAEAWPYFRLVLQPIVRRFPDLLGFGISRERAAQQAADALTSDPSLQQAILERLAKLEEGQELVAAKLHVFEAVLADHERRLQVIERSMRGGPLEQAPLPEPGSDSYSDFRRAVQVFVDQAGAPRFRDIRGAWLEPEKSFESTVSLPGAEACRIAGSGQGRHASCRMFRKSFAGWGPELTSEGLQEARRLAQVAYQETVQMISFSVPPHWRKSQDHIVGQPTRSEKTPEGGLIIRLQTDADVFLAAEPGNGRRVEVRFQRTSYVTMYLVTVRFFPAGSGP